MLEKRISVVAAHDRQAANWWQFGSGSPSPARKAARFTIGPRRITSKPRSRRFLSATHFFVAFACIPDLLKFAKHLFFAATLVGGQLDRPPAFGLLDCLSNRVPDLLETA
jgi:hypothetical protein